MIYRGSFSQDSGRGHTLRELQISSPKFWKIPLKPSLYHPYWSIQIGLKWLTLSHFKKKMIKVGKKEWTCSYVIKVVKSFYLLSQYKRKYMCS